MFSGRYTYHARGTLIILVQMGRALALERPACPARTTLRDLLKTARDGVLQRAFALLVRESAGAFRRCFLAAKRPGCRLEPMRSPLGIFLSALALLQLLGGHWAVLQTGAWMGMVVQYSQQAGLKAGLAQAFDGEHPCPVCKAIQAGKKHEQKKAPLLRAELKKDYLAPWSRFQFDPGWVGLKYPGFDACFEGVAFEPAVPPPRRA